MSSVMDVFLEFLEHFQNSYIKEQSYSHAVGTLNKMDGLFRDLLRSALSLVTHNICIFKTF